MDGIIHCNVLEGSCNSWIFNRFFRELLAEMNPYPARNSVLVLDNVAFHHNSDVIEMAAER
jgi:hypothetical protein